MYILLRKIPGTGVIRSFKINRFESITISLNSSTEPVGIPGVTARENFALKVVANGLKVTISWKIIEETADVTTETDVSKTKPMEIIDYLLTQFENKEISQDQSYHLFLGHDAASPAYPDAYGGGAENSNPASVSQANSWYTSSTDLKFKGFVDDIQISKSRDAPTIWDASLTFIVGVPPS